MKNADMPAMPQSFAMTGQECGTAVSYMANDELLMNIGLTKREMFAMNAPTEIPNWFVDDWIYNDGNYRVGGSHELAGNDRRANLDSAEMMKITKEWRYAYADLMLSED